MKRSTLYPLHQALGATFTTTGEWELPQHFGDLPQNTRHYDTGWGSAMCHIAAWCASRGESGNVLSTPWSRMTRRACNQARDATLPS